MPDFLCRLLYPTLRVSDLYGRTLPPGGPLVKVMGTLAAGAWPYGGPTRGPGSEPGVAELLGGLLGRGVVDVDPPYPVGSGAGGANLDLPRVLFGAGPPL